MFSALWQSSPCPQTSERKSHREQVVTVSETLPSMTLGLKIWDKGLISITLRVSVRDSSPSSLYPGPPDSVSLPGTGGGPGRVLGSSSVDGRETRRRKCGRGSQLPGVLRGRETEMLRHLGTHHTTSRSRGDTGDGTRSESGYSSILW